MKVIGLISIIYCLGFTQVHSGFVNLKKVIPNVLIDLRYHTEDNFVGAVVDGYETDICYISKEAANALKKVQQELNTYGLGLKVFDAYRPQQAVNHFVRWAQDLDDVKMKSKYYPNEKKSELFEKGYIASKSGHTRGSTVDLTLIVLNGALNEELDMGTPWDFFSHKSATAYAELTAQQRKNRLLLKSIMEKYGFNNYSKEWWHFTLKNEPYPKTYFDFKVN